MLELTLPVLLITVTSHFLIALSISLIRIYCTYMRKEFIYIYIYVYIVT